MGNSGGSGEAVRYQYPSGNVYEGQFNRSKKRHGHGKYTWTDGAVYEGAWKDNKQSGQGVMRFPNGNVFEGSFQNNNPDGEGVLRTKFGESISGTFKCMGRFGGTPIAPICTYHLNVLVLDLGTQHSQHYYGPGTLHLKSGLVVLPNMQNPEVAVLPFAQMYEPPSEEQVAVGATPVASASLATPIAGSVPVAEQSTLQTCTSFALEERTYSMAPKPEPVPVATATAAPGPAQPVYQATAVPPSSANAELEQALIDREEQAEFQANQQALLNQGNAEGIAYGAHDPALNPPAPPRNPRPMNPLDPRLYF